ncbi:hypothetical protein Trydic_g1331 [Trypoxylus dichotomus]
MSTGLSFSEHTAMVNAQTQQTNGPYEDHSIIGPVIRVCQINIEDISNSKSECIGKLLMNQSVITIQLTHAADDYEIRSRGKIPGYWLLLMT